MHRSLELLGMCLAAAASTAACFSPTYPEGSACTESCPGDLICVDGRCTRGDGSGSGDAGLDASTGACPPTYVRNATTGSFYRVVGASAPQAAAVADCADDGAGTYLAIPDDLVESNALDSLANNDAWLGITDAAMEGTWLTVRGTAQTFFRWAPQPDGGVAENCAFIRDGAWQDVDCALTKPYICECR